MLLDVKVQSERAQLSHDAKLSPISQSLETLRLDSVSELAQQQSLSPDEPEKIT